MPIEFSCPACHQLVRTPDATAGKKGKCPQCGAIVQIPAVLTVGSVPATVTPAKPASKPTAQRLAAPKPQPPAPPPPPIEFSCVWCGELVRTPAASAGKRGKCPHCQRVVKIPKDGGRASGDGGRGTDLGLAEELPPMEAVKPASTPALGRSAARPARPEPAKPLPARPASPKPASPKPAVPPNPGLDFAPLSEPLPSAGLTPLPSDPFSGLTPLPELSAMPIDPLDGLIPLPGQGAELKPLPSLPADNFPTLKPLPTESLEVLTPLPDINPLGIPAQGYGYGRAPAVSQRPVISDARRRGLPWEREPSLDSFGETLKLVITAPHEAFLAMRRGGGIGNPLGFLIVSNTVAMMISLVELFLFQLCGLLFAQGVTGGEVRWEAYFLGFAVVAGIALFVALLGATIGSLFITCIYHIGLLLFGGANAGFEATYRVVAFGTGAVYMLWPIPLVGPFFAPVMYFVVLIYGLKYAHETTGGRSAGAVFVPMILASCCMCPIALMFSSSVPLLLSPLGR